MIGVSLNQYRITASIGAGGMGEVFRARDTRLSRDVAIKVLPKDFASDADRLRRFEQEAKTLAALNHPNVLTIHDAGVHEGAPYLVSELLEGKTLREEMNGGALPLRKATEFALQIAHGLAAAHGKGIIHRDLKPANIFVTKDGRVKILDFGLAKLRSRVPTDDGAAVPLDVDAAVTTTEPGKIMGTPAYMSPEQVRGESADHRSDIFASGCVFYEMLSGTRAFRGDTPLASMNAVLSEEPLELSSLRPDLPLPLIRLVQRCLEKAADRRFQSAHDLAFAIENAGTPSSLALRKAPAQPARLREYVLWAVTAVCLAGFAFTLFHSKKTSRFLAHQAAGARVRKFDLTLPLSARTTPGAELSAVISPDGKKLAYVNADGLWLRWLDGTAPTLLVATENIAHPFWSPQSKDVGYFEERKLYRVSISGGNPMLLGTAPAAGIIRVAGAAWLEDRILLSTGTFELYEVSAQGGRVGTALVKAEGETDFHQPSPLPDGRGALFVIHRTVGIDTIAVWTPGGQRKVLLQLPGSELHRPVFASTGHVLFHREDESRGVWAFPFSLEKLERTGEPFRISDIGIEPSVANDGTLIFSLKTGDEYALRQLTWVERSGKILNSIGPPMPGLRDQHLSPDEHRVVAVAGESLLGSDLWFFDVTGGGAVPFTRNEELDAEPRWWQDAQTIVFSRRSKSGFHVLSKSVQGAAPEQLVFEGSGHLSRSGKFLLLGQSPTIVKGARGYVLMADKQRVMVPFPEAFHSIHFFRLSPDDRLLAYSSEESGQPEVYLVSFPAFTNKTMVSRGGGRSPEWNPNGKELFYLTPKSRTLMAAKLKPDQQTTEEPAKLFDLPESIHGGTPWWRGVYEAAADGNRFLMLQSVRDQSSNRGEKPSVRVVLNWFEEFRDKK